MWDLTYRGFPVCSTYRIGEEVRRVSGRINALCDGFLKMALLLLTDTTQKIPHSLSPGLFLILQSHTVASHLQYLHYDVALWSSLLSPSVAFKVLMITLDPPGKSRTVSSFWGQIINNLTSICNLNFSLPCEVTYSQVVVVRIWTSLGGQYFAHHRHFCLVC